MASAGPFASSDLPRFTGGLRPVVDRVASLRASVHTKLLAGFMVGALLLLAMAGLSLAVLAHMADRVDELNRAQERLDTLRQLEYLVTVQSHYRAMVLLTHDNANLTSIAEAKTQLSTMLDELDANSSPGQRGVLARIRAADQRFDASGEQVQALYQAGQAGQAMQLHLTQEHPISHEIEQAGAILLNEATQQMDASQATVESDHRLLTGLVIAFSVISLLTALLLGFVMSWSFLLPLGTVHRALARLASGHFDQRVELTNQDEFGELGRNLNATSQELADIYGQLKALNAQLRGTNTELLAQLQAQVDELARSRGLITQAEERLRREIAEVLHSRVQNRLLMVWYRLEDAYDLLESQPQAARAVIAEARDQLDQIREQDVRELSHRLHPSIIRAGLLPALETLAEEIPRVEVTIAATAEVDALDHPAHNGIPEEVRLTAYRVVEEALGNVVKHAAATRVEIALHVIDASLAIEITDDGRGFDQRRLRTGLGLGSIAARVGRIGGQWSIGRSPTRGTRVSVVLPCSSADQTQDGLGTQVAFGQESGADPDGRGAVPAGV